jgi:FKBP-type peptidyl-prolyl cis-trans isomerase FkpA
MKINSIFKRVFTPIVSIFFCLFIAQACGGCKNNKNNNTVDYKKIENDLVEQNKKLSHKESEIIDAYIENNNWKNTVRTGTGLRYIILEKGNGELARINKIAKVNYKVSLLDGTICYSSETSGSKEFKIGEDDVEAGLHEGITYLQVGDKAKFLLPSHLAHGFTGDQRKIPSNSPIVYEIELLGIR